MAQCAVIGSDEFVVGFQLAGIKDIVRVKGDGLDEIRGMRKRSDVGIVIIEGRILEAMDADARKEVEDSMEPVFIPLSTRSEQDSLKKLIKRSIGVDLWS